MNARPLLLLLAAAAAAHAQEAPALPAPVPMERYEPLVAHSPFAPATAAAPAPPPKVESASFAKDFYLTGMARMGATSVVTLFSRDKQKRYSLAVGESIDGLTLASVEWAETTGQGKATLKKGEEFGIVGFDEAAMKQAPPPAAPAPQQPQAPGARPGGGPHNPYAALEERRRGNWRERWGRSREGGGGPPQNEWRRRERPVPTAPR